MINLKFIVDSNKLILINKEFITTGSVNQVECEFDFTDNDWIEMEKTAMYKINNIVTKVRLVNNKCYIPTEALENDGDLFVGVFGTKINNNVLEKRNTTGLIKLTIYEGSFI